MNQKAKYTLRCQEISKAELNFLFGLLNGNLTVVKRMGFTEYCFHSPSPQPHSLSAKQIQIKEHSGAHVSGTAAFQLCDLEQIF